MRFFPQVLLGWAEQYHLNGVCFSLHLLAKISFVFSSAYQSLFFFVIVPESLQLKLFFLFPFIVLK